MKEIGRIIKWKEKEYVIYEGAQKNGDAEEKECIIIKMVIERLEII